MVGRSVSIDSVSVIGEWTTLLPKSPYLEGVAGKPVMGETPCAVGSVQGSRSVVTVIFHPGYLEDRRWNRAVLYQLPCMPIGAWTVTHWDKFMVF